MSLVRAPVHSVAMCVCVRVCVCVGVCVCVCVYVYIYIYMIGRGAAVRALGKGERDERDWRKQEREGCDSAQKRWGGGGEPLQSGGGVVVKFGVLFRV